MKKLIFAPITLSLLAITLAGCGEGDGIYGQDGNDEFAVIRFEKGIDRQTNKEAVVRIDTMYRTGKRDVTIRNVIGNYNNQNIDVSDKSVILNEGFEGTLESRYIEVNGRTVKRPIYEKNSNKSLNYETTYRTLPLSGVNAGDYNVGSKTGFFTDLNNYPKIPNSISFPSGSVCYIPVTTSAISFFVLNDSNKTGYQTLDKWVEVTENRFGNSKKPIITTSAVGKNNEYILEKVKFSAVNNDPEYLYNGIDYKSSIHESDYINSNRPKPNEDTRLGVVDCTLVNDVAANFLQVQIKKYR